MSTLVVENLRKQYPTRGEPLLVLRDVSLELCAGQNLAVTGPSGSGKSTLLAILGTLEPPSGGRVILDGQDLARLDGRQLAAIRSRRIGVVFQESHLLPQCSALENVLLPVLGAGRVEPRHVARARELLRRVGLADRTDHRPGELSGGERQRVALARALVNGPALLLADEPTGSLDRATAERVGELLIDLQRQEPLAMIVATHSRRLAARMQRQLELNEGVLREPTEDA